MVGNGAMEDTSRDVTISGDEAKITLGLLSAVEANSAVTQRRVASELGIALGLANAYLKRCVRKGFVKVKQVPTNRYAYYLTPKGFAEKSRLTAEYLAISFNFFRSARDQCAALLGECGHRGWDRVALAGVSDLAEITVLCSPGAEVQIVGIVDPNAKEDNFAGLKVIDSLQALDGIDALIVTDFRNAQATYDRLSALFPTERILTPSLLNVSHRPPVFIE